MPDSRPITRQSLRDINLDNQKTIRHRLSLINTNQGTTDEKLRQIMRIGDIIYDQLITNEDVRFFIDEIKFKFLDIPAIQFDQIIRVQDWPELRDIAQNTAMQQNSWSSLENKLEHLHQEHDESMLQYTQRANQLYNDFMTMYGGEATPMLKKRTNISRTHYYLTDSILTSNNQSNWPLNKNHSNNSENRIWNSFVPTAHNAVTKPEIATQRNVLFVKVMQCHSI